MTPVFIFVRAHRGRFRVRFRTAALFCAAADCLPSLSKFTDVCCFRPSRGKAKRSTPSFFEFPEISCPESVDFSDFCAILLAGSPVPDFAVEVPPYAFFGAGLSISAHRGWFRVRFSVSFWCKALFRITQCLEICRRLGNIFLGISLDKVKQICYTNSGIRCGSRPRILCADLA